MSSFYLGGQVGASCLYELGGTAIDCGVQGLLGAEFAARAARDHRPLVITHAHSDHIGAGGRQTAVPGPARVHDRGDCTYYLPMLLDAAGSSAQRLADVHRGDVVKALQVTFTLSRLNRRGDVARVSGHIVGAGGVMLEHSGFRVGTPPTSNGRYTDDGCCTCRPFEGSMWW